MSEFVKNYMNNKGELVVGSEVFDENQLRYLLGFGKQNTSIKKLTFGEQLVFDSAPNPMNVDAID